MRSVPPTSPGALSIGELSRRTGVNIETIRYYERIKMLPAPPRTSTGRRVYGALETRSLTFIRRSRELGFTLDEVRALLALSAEDGKNTCGEMRQVAARHLADIRAKIVDLRAMARVLSDAVQRCDAAEIPGCPLIDTLSTPFSISGGRQPTRKSLRRDEKAKRLAGIHI
jgi:MerR family mercuric resistance operon transcriptional regulator